MADNLHSCPLTPRTIHLCVDMQRIFSAEGLWPTLWMDRVLPVVTELASQHPERTVFTRFIPPERATGYAGDVAAPLHAMEGCNAGATRPSAVATPDATCKALSSRHHHKQNPVLRIRRASATATLERFSSCIAHVALSVRGTLQWEKFNRAGASIGLIASEPPTFGRPSAIRARFRLPGDPAIQPASASPPPLVRAKRRSVSASAAIRLLSWLRTSFEMFRRIGLWAFPHCEQSSASDMTWRQRVHVISSRSIPPCYPNSSAAAKRTTRPLAQHDIPR
jgi:hypothetical protein